MAEENYKRLLSEIRREEEKLEQMHMMKKEFEKQKQESSDAFRQLSEAYSKREREQREHTEHERKSNAKKMEDMKRNYEVMLEMNRSQAEQQLAIERTKFEVMKQEQEHIRRNDEIKSQHQQQRLKHRNVFERLFDH